MRNASVHIVECQCQAQWHLYKYCRSCVWFHIESSWKRGSSTGLCVSDGSEAVADFIPSTLNIKVEISPPFNKAFFFPCQVQSGNRIKALPFRVTSKSLLARSSSSPVLRWEPSWHPQLMTGLNFPRSNLIAVQLCRLTICSLIVSLLTAFSVEQFERSGKPCFGDMEVFSHLKCNFTPCVAQ